MSSQRSQGDGPESHEHHSQFEQGQQQQQQQQQRQQSESHGKMSEFPDVAAAWADSKGLYQAPSSSRYKVVKLIGSGTYGRVYQAWDRLGQRHVALKTIRSTSEKDGFPLMSLREIAILQTRGRGMAGEAIGIGSVQGSQEEEEIRDGPEHIVDLLDVSVGDKGTVSLVFEYLPTDLSLVMSSRQGRKFDVGEVKGLVRDLLTAVAHLHSHNILHRDIKLSNLLVTTRGRVKLADFGLARSWGPTLPSGALSSSVVTLWYRAPELLLGSPGYSPAVDVWAIGCIVGELLAHAPLFPGNTPSAMLKLIVSLIGSPSTRIWPSLNTLPGAAEVIWPDQPYSYVPKRFGMLTPTGVHFLTCLLRYDPDARMTASQALHHPWLTSEQPAPVSPQIDLRAVDAQRNAASRSGASRG